MYQGKHVASKNAPRNSQRKRRLRWRKEFVLFCSVAVLLVGLVGGTIAYLVTETNPVVNEFTPATVDVEVTESFENNEKTNVGVTYTGDVKAYVRAMIAVYWKSDEPNSSEVYGGTPKYEVTQGNNEWIKIGDIYYYTKPVESGEEIPPFISKIVATEKAPEGYHLVVDVISEAIQAEPADAVEEAWRDVDVAADTKFLVQATSAG